MKPVLIGSRALNYWYPDEVPIKDSTDWDVISDNPIEGCEWHDPKILLNWLLARDWASDNEVRLPDGQDAFIMTEEGLAIIKRSHLWRNLSFGKHITHWQILRNVPLSLFSKRMLSARTKLTMEMFPQGNPNLNQSVEDFFKDAVKKTYSHDWLHEVVAYYDKPLYTRLQTDSSKAWCQEEKWNVLSHEDKIKCIAEEAHVIAIERNMVPSNWTAYPKLAYNKSVEKICTTLCSGWFRDYAIDNFMEVLSMFDEEKFKKVKTEIVSGRAVLFNN